MNDSMKDFSTNATSIQQNKIFSYTTIIFGLVYHITFIALFIAYTEKYAYVPFCSSLISWDKGLYAIMIIHIVFNLIETYWKYKSGDEPIDSIFFTIVTFITTGANIGLFICWIGVQSAYFNLSPSGVCGSLGQVNLAYIIINFILIAFALVVCIMMCCCMGFITGLMAKDSNADKNTQHNLFQSDKQPTEPLDEATQKLIQDSWNKKEEEFKNNNSGGSGDINQIKQ